LANVGRFWQFLAVELRNNKLQRNVELHLLPFVKSVAALPCENRMFNYTTLQQLIKLESLGEHARTSAKAGHLENIQVQ